MYVCFIIFRLENTCFVIVPLTISSPLASFNAMTSTEEDTQPKTEMIAPVRPPGETLGPLGQINEPPSQELNI